MPDGGATTFDVLMGGRCPRCRLVMFPMRPACRRCGSSVEEAQVSPAGSVEASTTVRVAGAGFGPPYRIGYVKLDDGPRVLALFECAVSERIAHGRRVRVDRSEDGVVRAWPDPA